MRAGIDRPGWTKDRNVPRQTVRLPAEASTLPLKGPVPPTPVGETRQGILVAEAVQLA